jgi:Amt family ammonium transporter
MIITWIKYKKPDVSMTLNGSLAGLVAVTAGCNNVSATGAFFIGLIAAFIVVFGIEFIDQKCHIDDPVGAIGVHFMCGAAGTVLVGLFDEKQGIISGHILNPELTASQSFGFLGVQILGVLTVALWGATMSAVIFLTLKKTVGLRASKEEELLGLDIMEHNLVSSYADFEPSHTLVSSSSGNKSADSNVNINQAIEVTDSTPKEISESNAKLTKITIITRPDKFETLKTTLDAIGITGMTLTNVQGCGMQRGDAKYYRGAKIDMHLLPKIKLEVVVSKVPVEQVVDAAKKALYTGNYGDGKIFIYSVEDAVKVRTGEKGYAALQDE